MKDKRERMISVISGVYGLDSPDVLSVMLHIPRHKFVPREKINYSYEDNPVPIGFGQTMSQPYTVAVMTKLITEALGSKHEIRSKSNITKLQKKGRESKYRKVLEIGTGSGYQAAVLSKFFKEVFTVEIIPELFVNSKITLSELGYKNVHVRLGSGEWGWKGASPFDAILITAGLNKVPKKLFDQLKIGGILVAPVGSGKDKIMIRYKKTGKDTFSEEKFGIFHFVPFVRDKNSKSDKIS